MKAKISAAVALILLSGLVGQEALAQKGSKNVRLVFYVWDVSTDDFAKITGGQVVVTSGSDSYIGLIGGRHSSAVVEVPATVSSASATVDAAGFCAQPQIFSSLNGQCRNCLYLYVEPCSSSR
jgi:hypothetical protein